MRTELTGDWEWDPDPPLPLLEVDVDTDADIWLAFMAREVRAAVGTVWDLRAYIIISRERLLDGL